MSSDRRIFTCSSVRLYVHTYVSLGRFVRILGLNLPYSSLHEGLGSCGRPGHSIGGEHRDNSRGKGHGTGNRDTNRIESGVHLQHEGNLGDLGHHRGAVRCGAVVHTCPTHAGWDGALTAIEGGAAVCHGGGKGVEKKQTSMMQSIRLWPGREGGRQTTDGACMGGEAWLASGRSTAPPPSSRFAPGGGQGPKRARATCGCCWRGARGPARGPWEDRP